MFIPWWGLIRWMFFSTILAPCSSRSFFPLINLHQTQTHSKQLVELISLDKHLGEVCKFPMNWAFTQIHTSPKALWDTYNKGHRLNQENKLLHEWHQNSSSCYSVSLDTRPSLPEITLLLALQPPLLKPLVILDITMQWAPDQGPPLS